MKSSRPTIKFKVDWAEADEVSPPELGATWAALQVWAGSHCVTLVQDTETSSLRSSIYCALYPLAEWIAYNWWFLSAHNRGPVPFASYDPTWSLNGRLAGWREMHNLRSAGDGFLWPDLTLVPEGDITSAEWHPDTEPHNRAPIKYVARGSALLDGEESRLRLAGLVETVLARLDEAGVSETPLHREWGAIRAADESEREFCLAAAQLGVDPFDLDAEAAAAIVDSGSELEPELREELFGTVEIDQLRESVHWIERSSEIRRATGKAAPWLPILRAKDLGRRAAEMPWDTGYRQAQTVRKVFKLSPEQALDMSSLFVLRHARAPDPSLLALGTVTEDGLAALVEGDRYPKRPARFLAGRAIWHFAAQSDRSRFLLTDKYSGTERIARAFSAELLAPAMGIAQVLGDRLHRPSEMDIARVARLFNVSTMLVHRQIENQLVGPLA